jgi:hypothetical protein
MNVIVNGNVTKYKIYAKKVTNYCDWVDKHETI